MALIGKRRLTASQLCEIVGEWSIFQRYLPGFKKVKEKFHSPWRRDSEPSCSVIVTSEGHLFFKDFGTDEKGGWFWLIMKATGCSEEEVGNQIEKDFYTNNPSIYQKPQWLIPSPAKKKYADIRAEVIPWDEKSLSYWREYEFTQEDLEEGEIFHINNKELYIDYQRMLIPEDEFVYGYWFPKDEENGYEEGWKILRPFAKEKKNKWRTNIPIYRVENLYESDISLPLIISKSRKDRLILERLINSNGETYAICNTQNESEDWILQNPKNLERVNLHPKVVVSFDSDSPGIKSCKNLTEKYGWEYLNTPRKLLPNFKDWSDWAWKEGIAPIQRFLKQKNII